MKIGRIILTAALITLAAAAPARAEVIAEIHTEGGIESALEITEPCPAGADPVEQPAAGVYSGIQMTDEEARLLRSILALESQGEGLEGQKAVVEVIFNRVRSKEWANSVHDVIYQKGQFATVKYLNDPYVLPDEAEDDAISEVLRETETVLPTDYVYFSTKKVNGKDFIKINHHWFSR